MATLAKEFMSTEPAPHKYHADAYVLDAQLQQPVTSDIDKTGFVKLPEDGTYSYVPVVPFNLKGVLSYENGYTQVAGHRSLKHHGFVTLATSVLERINVLDVVTADRVVAQISTEHPEDGQVPSVTFLGTRFVNLHIGGHKVEVEPNLHILGPKPKKDKSYFETAEVLDRMSQQYSNIRKTKNLPDWAAEKYRWDKAAPRKGQVSCSVINKITGAPGIAFGHVIDLPHFGKIFLGELTVTREPAPTPDQNETYHFSLKMIRLEMGCIGTGNATVVALDANGTGTGGHH